MKTLAASEVDYNFDDRRVRMTEDFWAIDISALYSIPARYYLRWSREDRRDPSLQGIEELTLDLIDVDEHRVYDLPGDRVRASYAMASPARGEGSQAAELSGTIHVNSLTASDVGITLHLRARMVRTDRPGEFHEDIRGSYRLPKVAPR